MIGFACIRLQELALCQSFRLIERRQFIACKVFLLSYYFVNLFGAAKKDHCHL